MRVCPATHPHYHKVRNLLEVEIHAERAVVGEVNTKAAAALRVTLRTVVLEA